MVGILPHCPFYLDSNWDLFSPQGDVSTLWNKSLPPLGYILFLSLYCNSAAPKNDSHGVSCGSQSQVLSKCAGSILNSHWFCLLEGWEFKSHCHRVLGCERVAITRNCAILNSFVKGLTESILNSFLQLFLQNCDSLTPDSFGKGAYWVDSSTLNSWIAHTLERNFLCWKLDTPRDLRDWDWELLDVALSRARDRAHPRPVGRQRWQIA